MSAARKHRLVDCDPQWTRWDGRDGVADAIKFRCPEGHFGCWVYVPFTPSLDGAVTTSPQSNGAHWSRVGDTFETLTLAPSIRAIPVYASKQAALDAGCKEEHLSERLWCHLHIFVRDGQIDFCGDSK